MSTATRQTQRYEECVWHARLANEDEAQALRRIEAQYIRAHLRTITQGVSPAPSTHIVARAWRWFCANVL